MQITIRGIKGLGDCLSTVPLIRRMRSNCDRLQEDLKVYLPTENELKFFKNNPYAEYFTMDNYFPEESDIFTLVCESDVKYIFEKTNQISMLNVGSFNIVDFYTIQCGFQLSPLEKNLEYFPDNSSILQGYDIPDDYVVLNPSFTWPTRTWRRNYWQELINLCEQRGIFVILTGNGVPHNNILEDDTMGLAQREDGHYLYNDMGFHSELQLDYGLDLCNQTNLDDFWHILNSAKVVITCDTGCLHLAGTTDTHIVYITSNINPYHRAPFRNGSQVYKLSFVSGKDCDFFCGSNNIYNKRIHNSYLGCPRIATCLEGFDEFDCKAEPNLVFDEFVSMFDSIDENYQNKIDLKEEQVESKDIISYWFTNHETNFKHSSLSDTSRIWLKFWDDMDQQLKVSFRDVGGRNKSYGTRINVEKSGVWWFDMPNLLSSYNKLGITVIASSGVILYDEVLG